MTASDEGFYFCDQYDIRFPPTPGVQGENKWMTEGQEELTKVYGTTVLVLLILYCVFILGQGTIRLVLSLVRGVYKVRECPLNTTYRFITVSF